MGYPDTFDIFVLKCHFKPKIKCLGVRETMVAFVNFKKKYKKKEHYKSLQNFSSLSELQYFGVGF